MSQATATDPQAYCSQCGRQFPVDHLMQFGSTLVCADCKEPFLQSVREGAATSGHALPYASFGIRFVALMIDGVILFIASLMINALFGASLIPGALAPGTDPGAAFGAAVGRMFGIAFFVNMAMGFCYYTLMLKTYGATLGKMAVKVKIVTPDGGPISFGRAAGRYFCSSFLEPLTLSIGYLIALFDNQNRTLHDRICGTRAIRSR